MSGNSNKISYKTLKGSSDLTVTEPIHNVEGIKDPVSKLVVGSRLSCYGRTFVQVNGRIIENYQHFTYGDYILDPPLVFKSFHVDLKNNRNLFSVVIV